jgi:hypothetical protein
MRVEAVTVQLLSSTWGMATELWRQWTNRSLAFCIFKQMHDSLPCKCEAAMGLNATIAPDKELHFCETGTVWRWSI